MLVLNREIGEQVIIDLRPLVQKLLETPLVVGAMSDDLLLVELTVVELRGNRLRLGVQAIPEIKVHRKEVFRAIENGTRPQQELQAIKAEREGRN